MENITGSTNRSDKCRRCNRKLKTPESVEVGYGPTCFKKFLAESLMKPLFKMEKETEEDGRLP